ncbi:hypothetical protein ATCC90586_005059 [Pythium insidiosum]|nr:hypothetical protein ATCC90586_005059 [Pythium insidiosum]
MSTQVVTYMKGLVDGSIKIFLFRDLRQAYIHSAAYRPPKGNAHDDGSEPMDLSAADASSTKHPNKRSMEYHRCQKNGHLAYECLAPKPTPRSRSGSKGSVDPRRLSDSQLIWLDDVFHFMFEYRQLVGFLDARNGQCFPLPGPWDADDYVPTSFDTSTTGSPGPSYYTNSPPASAASGDEDDGDESTKSDDEGKSVASTSI